MTDSSLSEIDPVLRIPNVKIAREALESVLGVGLFRYEPERHANGIYAQINFPVETGWVGVVALLQKIGPALQRCVSVGEIGRPELDVGFYVPADSFNKSLVIPLAAGQTIFSSGVDLRISVYLTSDKEEQTQSLART